MKAITLIRPWDQAVVRADIGKDIENRTWKPWRSLIGQRIAIHAGRKFDRQGQRFIQQASGIFLPEDDCPSGVIVGTAVLAEVVEFSGSKWFFGPLGWRLRSVVQLPEPVPCKGAQGLWDVPDDARVLVERGMAQVGVRP